MNKSHAPQATLATLAISASILAGACAPKYYAPNAQNVPLLTHAGEGSVGASINLESNRADVHAAAAVTDNFAVQANGAVYFPRDEDSTGDGGSGGLAEFGVGYYKPLQQNFVFETFLLGAYGGVENHFPSSANDNPGTTGKLNANLVRIAFQPAIGFKQPKFESAISTRFAMLNYFNIDGNLIADSENQQEFLRDHSLQFLLEPALTVRGGFQRVKIEAQLGLSINLGDKEFPQDKTWGSLGLVYHFDPTR